MTRPIFKKLGIALVSLALSLLVVELTFRAAGVRIEYYGPRVDRLMTREGFTKRIDDYGHVPFSTVRSTYSDKTINHVHNSVGWRDVEHDQKKPAGTRRILGLGDSYLWGQGVQREDICLTRLGEMLDAETINTAMSNRDTVHERNVLVHRGLAYDPDRVIVHFVPNDVDPAVQRYGSPRIDFYDNYTAHLQSRDRLSRWSWAWARARATWQATSRRSWLTRDAWDSWTRARWRCSPRTA